MAAQSSPLHMLLFPFLAHGHLLPLIDVARLFAVRGVKCTIVTTPANVAHIEPTIDMINNFLKGKSEISYVPISISLIPFPLDEVGLPDGVEYVSVSNSPEVHQKIFRAILLLEEPFENKLKEINPDAFVSDTFFTWSADVSARTGILRLVFNGRGSLARCGQQTVLQIIESLPVDTDKFVVPGLPHKLEMYRTQFLFPQKSKGMLNVVKHNSEMEAKSYGEIVNSFLELEADYAAHWRNVFGRRAWLIGPVTLCNKEMTVNSSRGRGNSSIGAEELLNWLDGKRIGSVVYICFGSMANSDISLEQIKQIGIALDDSNRDFVWVVKSSSQDGYDEWLDAFERRTHEQKRGLVIRGWAPQLLLLNHPSVGGFMTHCGWNSTLEAISTGIPMITWPMNGDQFFNEKLIVKILGVGAAIGVKEGGSYLDKWQLIGAGTIRSVMEAVVGESVEAEAVRRRAKELKEKAEAAVQVGGSSYVELGNLIEELLARRK